MRRTIAVIVGVAILAVPSVALALSRVLQAQLASGATIDLQFTIRHGKATKITRLEANNIPMSCTGFGATATSYFFHHPIVISRKGTFHAKDVRNSGRTTYTLSGHFITLHKAAGKLHIQGTVPGCRSADSGVLRWTAKQAPH